MTTGPVTTDPVTTDLGTTYLGLRLAHPVVASSSPLTGSIDTLLALEAAGAAAVVLPSLFEEQVDHDVTAIVHDRHLGGTPHAEAHGGYFPDLGHTSVEVEHLALVAEARAALAIPVIASLNGTTDGGWTHYAAAMQDAGAHAVELNIYLVAADPDITGAEVEDRYLRLVEQVRAEIDVPLAVKVGPSFSSPANMARRLADAGADALVLFNRWYQPDIDLDRLEVVPDLVLSTPSEMRLALRWVAILRGRIDAGLAATTGVHDADAVVKLVLAGADVTMMTAALLLHGPAHLTAVVDGVRSWFTDRGYVSLDQARGSMGQASVPDPGAFERANYMATLGSYTARRHR